MGGTFILGATDKIPRQIVGTNVFQNFSSLQKDIFDLLGFRIEITELFKKGRYVTRGKSAGKDFAAFAIAFISSTV